VTAVTQIDEPAKLADTIASHLAIKIAASLTGVRGLPFVRTAAERRTACFT
jgi:hypothetical protein